MWPVSWAGRDNLPSKTLRQGIAEGQSQQSGEHRKIANPFGPGAAAFLYEGPQGRFPGVIRETGTAPKAVDELRPGVTEIGFGACRDNGLKAEKNRAA